MRKELIHAAFLFLIDFTALQTAVADPVVRLAEPNEADPTFLSPTTETDTTATTTTTLPTIQRCPDTIAGASSGSRNGIDYWTFDGSDLCGLGVEADIYCFENPSVTEVLPEQAVWQLGTPWWGTPDFFPSLWTDFVDWVQGTTAGAGSCYVCGCIREFGCFPPGVKITLADGSSRKIEEIRAGDLVRNAKTGAPVKVRQVIEGPEALPLIRFGFEGTTVTTSQAHPVLAAAGLKPANELTKGDTIFDAQGQPHRLTILEMLPLEEGQRVINVNLDASSSDADERLIVSDGIITGDIVLQGLLKGRK